MMLFVLVFLRYCVVLSWTQPCQSDIRCYTEIPSHYIAKGAVLLCGHHTMTWNRGKKICSDAGLRLCHSFEICPSNYNKHQSFLQVLPGTEMVPVADQKHEWLKVGSRNEERLELCHRYSHKYGKPPVLSYVHEFAAWKGQVFCCPQCVLDRLFIGSHVTYDDAENFCENYKGNAPVMAVDNSNHKVRYRLCHSGQICNRGVPRWGELSGNNYTPVSDEHNEWLNIGTEEGTCQTNSKPSWGLDKLANSTVKGYVYCCGYNLGQQSNDDVYSDHMDEYQPEMLKFRLYKSFVGNNSIDY